MSKTNASEKNYMQEKALRLMEALSSVDEELIDRSESADNSGTGKVVSPTPGKRSKIYVFTKYLAACAVFMAVCVGGFGLYVSKTWRAGQTAPSTDTASYVNGTGGSMAGMEDTVMEAVTDYTDSGEMKSEGECEGISSGAGISNSVNKSDNADNSTGAESRKNNLEYASDDGPEAVEHISEAIPEGFAEDEYYSAYTAESDNIQRFRWVRDDEHIGVYFYGDEPGTDVNADIEYKYADIKYQYENIDLEIIERNIEYEEDVASFEACIIFADGSSAYMDIRAKLTPEQISGIIKSMYPVDD